MEPKTYSRARDAKRAADKQGLHEESYNIVELEIDGKKRYAIEDKSFLEDDSLLDDLAEDLATNEGMPELSKVVDVGHPLPPGNYEVTITNEGLKLVDGPKPIVQHETPIPSPTPPPQTNSDSKEITPALEVNLPPPSLPIPESSTLKAELPQEKVVHESTVKNPTKLVWNIADQMLNRARETNCKTTRRIIMDECIKQGVATYTARTQFQQWLVANRNSGTDLSPLLLRNS